jgi:hypothetical protein
MGKRQRSPSRIAIVTLAVLLILFLTSTALSAGPADGSVKESFKKMGRAIGQAGKEVGKSAAKAGKTIGRESQKVWYRGVEVSKPALEKARAETRRALQKTLDAMDRSILSLKAELHRLNGGSASRDGDDG